MTTRKKEKGTTMAIMKNIEIDSRESMIQCIEGVVGSMDTLVNLDTCDLWVIAHEICDSAESDLLDIRVQLESETDCFVRFAGGIQ